MVFLVKISLRVLESQNYVGKDLLRRGTDANFLIFNDPYVGKIGSNPFYF